MNLSEMQLLVIPVTTKLLTRPNRVMDIEFPVAQERHIPVLPLMMEHGLDDVFSSRFGNLQYLAPNDTDETRRNFDEVLETYIRSVLVSSELAERVRAAFDAYIFLSYRKKDRKKAQELMRLIHDNPLCRDIAIWYDEFLTPGEDFNQAIGKMLEQSDLFALVVTPNLVNEVNYVMTTEYPAARKHKKQVFPVEMEKTDRRKLEKFYEALPPCVPVDEDEEFRMALLEKVRQIAVREKDHDPEHNFLIGLAYLDGIDLEVDLGRALELITEAADAGVPEAIAHLIMMYETGKGTERDYIEGIRWREKQAALLRELYEHERNESFASQLVVKLWDLGEARYELRMLEAAKAAYHEICIVSDKYAASGNSEFRGYLSISYIRLGDMAEASGDVTGAREYYEKGLVICEELAEETRTLGSWWGLSVSYERVGRIAKASGDMTGAREYFEKSLAISEELAEETDTVRSRLNLSVNYGNLGDIAKASGDMTRAREYYEKSLAIDEELAEETGTVESRRNLSISYDRLGDMAKAGGDVTGAREYYEKSHAIREELAEETGTVGSRRDLSISYERLGDIAKASGDVQRARLYYEKCLTIREELVRETGVLQACRDLAVACFKSGMLYFNDLCNSLDKAKEIFERIVEISRECDDEYLAEMGKKAEQILEDYF